MNPTIAKEETRFNEFSNYKALENSDLQMQRTLDSIEISEANYKKILKKITSNLFIFLGVFLSFGSSLVIFNIFFNAAPANFLLASIYFLFGSFLTILGSQTFGKKESLYLVLLTPTLSFFLAFIFTLAPLGYRGQLFGWISLLFYPVILSCFYSAKEYFDEPKLK